MNIDKRGFRAGVAMILVNNQNRVFWAKRIKQHAWQFPQGGILEEESPEEAMFRELHEEVGLDSEDVDIIAHSKDFLYYRLPTTMIRHYSQPVCIGQKQKWYLLRLVGDETHINFNETSAPEFDDYRWIYYWTPVRKIITFKRRIYRQALKEFSPYLFDSAV